MDAGKVVLWVTAAVGVLSTGGAAAQSANSQSVTSQGASRIYRCVVDEQVVFTDRACASGAAGTQVELTPVNVAAAPLGSPGDTRRSSSVSTRPAARAVTASIAEEQARAKQRCDRLNDQLSVIESKLRAGYSVRQGERLRERQRTLEAQRRTERCRR